MNKLAKKHNTDILFMATYQNIKKRTSDSEAFGVNANEFVSFPAFKTALKAFRAMVSKLRGICTSFKVKHNLTLTVLILISC